jgi:hypothetical protein
VGDHVSTKLNLCREAPSPTTPQPATVTILTMNPHTCQYCDTIMIDLPDYGDHFITIEKFLSTLCLDVEVVKSAVRDGCTFYQWALSIEPDDLPDSMQGEYLDEHTMNIVRKCLSSDDEGSSSESLYASIRSDIEVFGNSKEVSADIDVGPEPRLDATLTIPQSLDLHLKATSMYSKRRFLLKDIVRSDAPRPRHSFHWKGPQLDFVAPKGTSCTALAPCGKPIV